MIFSSYGVINTIRDTIVTLTNLIWYVQLNKFLLPVPALGQLKRPPENFTCGPLYPPAKWKVKVVLHTRRFSSDFAFHAYLCDFSWTNLTDMSSHKMRLRPILHLRTLVWNLRTYFDTFSYVIIPYLFGFLNPIKTGLIKDLSCLCHSHSTSYAIGSDGGSISKVGKGGGRAKPMSRFTSLNNQGRQWCSEKFSRGGA